MNNIQSPAPATVHLPVVQLETASREELLFPPAVTVKDRNRISSHMTWAKYRKEKGIKSDTERSVVKRHQEEFMATKKQLRQQSRRIAAALVASDGFDFTVDTWKNKKGEQQFQVRGHESKDADDGKKLAEEKAKLQSELAAKNAALDKMKSKLLESGLSEEDVAAIVAGQQ